MCACVRVLVCVNVCVFMYACVRVCACVCEGMCIKENETHRFVATAMSSSHPFLIESPVECVYVACICAYV